MCLAMDRAAERARHDFASWRFSVPACYINNEARYVTTVTLRPYAETRYRVVSIDERIVLHYPVVANNGVHGHTQHQYT